MDHSATGPLVSLEYQSPDELGLKDDGLGTEYSVSMQQWLI